MSDVIELEDKWYGHIREACIEASKQAEKLGKPVHFEFNETHVIAQPGESAETLQERWQEDMEAAAKAYREHPDRITEAAERKRKPKNSNGLDEALNNGIGPSLYGSRYTTFSTGINP